MSMTKEQIIDRLLKIKALAEKGSKGERENAAKLLASLMAKYGIEAEDLESDKTDLHMAFTGNGDFDFDLFLQVAAKQFRGRSFPGVKNLKKIPKKYIKTFSELGHGPANSNVAIECTRADFIEIISTFEIYKEDLHKQAGTFFYAYLDTNDLLVPSNSNGKQPTEDEIDRVLSAKLMSQGIKKKTINKLIEE